jgi:hypothetical protein
MATRQDVRSADLKMDPAALYLEEIFTDRQIGTIRRLTPVKPDGSRDPERSIIYTGETQVMSTMGALPIAFEIEAKSLDEAATKFGPQAKEAIDRTMREIQELRRQAASSIIVPPAGSVPGGGMPGGGKIQIP